MSKDPIESTIFKGEFSKETKIITRKLVEKMEAEHIQEL